MNGSRHDHNVHDIGFKATANIVAGVPTRTHKLYTSFVDLVDSFCLRAVSAHHQLGRTDCGLCGGSRQWRDTPERAAAAVGKPNHGLAGCTR